MTSTRIEPAERVIIVGAGTAGCIAAARLSQDAHREVLLLEAGPDRGPAGGGGALSSVNWLLALNERAAFYPDLFAKKLTNDEPRLYQRGRGVGGSGLVNAMLALPGLPSDYDGYADRLGLDRWSWTEVQPWLEMLKPDLSVSAPEEQTPVDRALLAAAESLGMPGDVDTFGPEDGAGLLWRTASQNARRSSLELALDPARGRPNLDIRGDSQVDRLVLDGGRVLGVRLIDGTEILADRVILTAGVFETPCILLRSGMTRPGIGEGLQDHPAASVYFSMRPDVQQNDLSIPCIGAVMRLSSSVGSGDIHLLPLHGSLIESDPPAHGLVMAAVMKTTSVGSLRLNPEDPFAPPIVDERMLSTPEDRTAMREAIDALGRVLATEAFDSIVEHAFIDELGTPLSVLDDEATFEAWLNQHVGDYFHAVGTAKMGAGDDPAAVVDQQGKVHGFAGVSIWDASILPEVPSANTHLPVAMLAERLSAAFRSGDFR